MKSFLTIKDDNIFWHQKEVLLCIVTQLWKPKKQPQPSDYP